MTWILTEKLEKEILEALENGEGLNRWCKTELGRPSRGTVLKWQRENEDFCAKCVRAREAAGELSLDEQKDIIDKTLSGEYPADVARVALSAMQWRAEKLAPKKYGKKLELSGDEKNPVKMDTTVKILMIDSQPQVENNN